MNIRIVVGIIIAFLVLIVAIDVFFSKPTRDTESEQRLAQAIEDIRHEDRQQMRDWQQQWEGIWIIETLDYKPPDTVMSDELVDFISWHWHFYSSGRFKSILASKTKSDERTILTTASGTYELGATRYTFQPTHLNSVAIDIISAERGKWFAVGDELVLTPHGDGHVKKLRRKTEISTPHKSQVPPARQQTTSYPQKPPTPPAWQQKLWEETPGYKEDLGTAYYKDKYREARRAYETAKSNYRRNASALNEQAWDDATNKLDHAYLHLERSMNAGGHNMAKQRELEAFTDSVIREISKNN